MKTGLVLEGGALRTIFSSGACDGLLLGEVMTDYVVGVSAGIAYGVSYVSKQRGRNLEIVSKFAGDHRYMGVRNLLRRDNRAYFGLKFVFEDIPNQHIPFDYKTFAAYPGQVEAVVTNLNTGKAEYMEIPRDDKGFALLQATCAMPLLFPIFHINGQPYLDGGAADAIPYQRAFDMGCDRVVVILTRPRDYKKGAEKTQKLIERKYRGYPNFCATMANRAEAYNESRRKLFELEKEGKVLVLAPETTHGVSRIERDVNKLRRLWQDGYEMAADRLDEIRAYLSGRA